MPEDEASTASDPREIVRAGYDRIAGEYAAWSAKSTSEQRDRFTDYLLATLPPGSTLLDLGCGHGLPATGRLAERFVVTGVDFSEAQIRAARRNVPGGCFLCEDMLDLDFPESAFEIIIAYFSIIHVPLEHHERLFRAIHTWLTPGGVFIFSTGASGIEAGYEEDWLGAPMYWSHYDPEDVRKLLDDTGLLVIEEVREMVDEDGTPVPFVWFHCRKHVVP